MDEDLEAVKAILNRVQQKMGDGAISSPAIIDLVKLAALVLDAIEAEVAARA